jgi:hypothetical protein
MTTHLGVPIYLGLEAIARRLGVSPNTVLNWHARGRVLMYRVRRGPRYHWRSDEALIVASLAALSQADRAAREARRAQRRGSA